MLENFKSQMTDEKKAIFGAIGIVLTIILFSFCHYAAFMILCYIMMLPAIFLVFPSKKTRYNKALSIVFIFILGFFFIIAALIVFGSIVNHVYYTLSDYLVNLSLVGLLLYGIFCAYLIHVPIGDEGIKHNKYHNPYYYALIHNKNKANANKAPKAKFCNECGAEVSGNSKFCKECGKEL